MKKYSWEMFNDIEIKLYELLQIRIFQKLVFGLERLIHKRDGGENQNYHLKITSNKVAEPFTKYLFYNGLIHIRNLIYIIIYFGVQIVFFNVNGWDIPILLFGIKDIYCVMLQRYNYLRIKKYTLKLDGRREILTQKVLEEVKKSICERYTMEKCESDLEIIKRIKKKIVQKEIIIMQAEELEALKRLNKLISS